MKKLQKIRRRILLALIFSTCILHSVPDSAAAPVLMSEAAEVPAEVSYALSAAALEASQYDYDAAISRLEKLPDPLRDDERVEKAIARYEEQKEKCTAFPLEEVTHIFFHTLIYDTDKAFDGDFDSAGYNQVMTTIKEFKRILNALYARGYVLVSPHDLAGENKKGKMRQKKLMLPEGKKPIVLSQDDVSYYHYMDGDGFASRLLLDENGVVKNEYILEDGSAMIGDFDLVPIVDSFIQTHPDFSYHGHKGVLAMTGYNGVLGYRTDEAYRTWEGLTEDQLQFLNSHPEFDFEKEVREATEVADALKKTGWEFASHTWGHRNAAEASDTELADDDAKWKRNVAPILGDTDMIFFAFGADIGDWTPYSRENPKYQYYYDAGYRYFCNVDSNVFWIQLTDEYFRQGRRNVDGYRMYYNPEMLSDLMDVNGVWDNARPTPVSTG